MSSNLVTGATGLLGSRLVFDLLRKGRPVRAMKRPGSDLSLIKKYFKNDPGLFSSIDWFDGDILDIFSLEDALNDIDRVYHCAAKVSFDSSGISSMMQVNINGTTNLVNMCLDAGNIKLCHVSSVAAIGRSLDGEQITEQSVWQTSSLNSNYAISKYGAEREVWRGIAEGLDAVIVNPTIIIGRGNWEEGSSSLINKASKGMKFYTLGTNGFVDVADVTEVMIKLAESDISGERFILNAENIPYREFFGMMAGFFHRQPPAYLAGPVLSGMAWRVEKIRSLFSGRPPLITRETARTASNRYYYSNEKIINRLTFRFRPVKESLEQVCREFSEDTV